MLVLPGSFDEFSFDEFSFDELITPPMLQRFLAVVLLFGLANCLI